MRITELEMPDQIDGKPTRNSLGRLIHPTVEGIRNFWNWFGDSKVVDSKGRPLVMYHGTYPSKMKTGKMLGDFDVFDRKASTEIVNRVPSYDQVGLWFSNKPGPQGAEQYGNFIYPVYLRAVDYKRTTFEAMVKSMYRFAGGSFDSKEFSYSMAKNVEPYRDFLKDNGYDSIRIFHDVSRENQSTEFKNQDVWIVLDPNQIKSAIGNNGNFSRNSKKITEIGFAHELGELNIPHSEIVVKSVKDGTIFGKPVRLFTSGESKLYFFEKNEKISALVLLDNNSIRAIKSFNKEKGLVFALVNYLVNIKNMKLKIGADEPLTPEGFQWLLKLISANSGLKIRDQSGNTVDPEKLKSEWNQSKISMGTQSGPTELTISESDAKWKTKLQMNEKRMIPFVYFKC